MFKRLFKNNWVVTIGGGVLSVLILRLVDKLFINDFFWEWIKSIFLSIGNFFNTEYSVKLYFLILLPILVIAAIIGVFLLAAMWDSKKGGVSVDPTWVNYTKDVFGGIQYRWQYDFFGKNYDIKNLQPYCNKCSCHLVDNKCPVCGENYYYSPQAKSQEEVLALIARNIDTGLYKNSPYFKTYKNHNIAVMVLILIYFVSTAYS